MTVTELQVTNAAPAGMGWRLHTETNVRDLGNSTTWLGKSPWTFQSDLCSEYQTFDLPWEEFGNSLSATTAG